MRVEQQRPWVIKIGGRLCDDAAVRRALAQACATAYVPLVLVHGGGCVVTSMQHKMGHTPRFVGGRRATDADQMPVVEMALSGSLNKELVRALLDANCLAAGLSGVDGNMVRCTLVPELGAVGLPELVQVHMLQVLLAAGVTPVLSPVSAGPDGSPVNVNADEFACAIAQALGAERLLLLSDVEAVRVEGRGQDLIADDQVEDLIARGEVDGGMIPKLRSAAVAVRAGVGEVRIGSFVAPLAQVRGTAVVAAYQEASHVG